jgi:hypothetical protein
VKRSIIVFLIICATTSLAAQKAYVQKTTGHPIIESATGVQGKAGNGSAFAYDELLMTGDKESASLLLEKNKITIGQNSVLAFLFTGTGTDPHPAFVPAAGIVSFTFIGTSSTPLTVIACGANISGDLNDRNDRGEHSDRSGHCGFTVYTAIDGSAVVSVTSGAVKIESGTEIRKVSAGETLDLKVNINAAEGRTIVMMTRSEEPVFNYAMWNEEVIRRLLDNPLEVLAEASSLAETHCAAYERLGTPYAKATAAWRDAADEYRSALAGGNEEAVADARSKKLFPAQDDRLRIMNEMRFHARMAMIARRFSLDPLFEKYTEAKPETTQGSAAAQEYISAYGVIMQRIDETAANGM